MLIKVAEFSKTPYGRTDEDGAFNGKRFRLQKLNLLLKARKMLLLIFMTLLHQARLFYMKLLAG